MKALISPCLHGFGIGHDVTGGYHASRRPDHLFSSRGLRSRDSLCGAEQLMFLKMLPFGRTYRRRLPVVAHHELAKQVVAALEVCRFAAVTVVDIDPHPHQGIPRCSHAN
jgi:hypothetical protein